MQVWPDGLDTPAVKARRHSFGGVRSAGEGGPAMMTEVVFLSWVLQMRNGRRGGLSIPEVKWCETRQTCWKDRDGQIGREEWDGRRSAEQNLVPESGFGQHAAGTQRE